MLVIETDLGNDPDDFLAICWLIARGQNIKLLIVNPGTPNQLSLANSIRLKCGGIEEIISVKDCVPRLTELSLADKLNFFVISPATATAAYIKVHPGADCTIFMQGNYFGTEQKLSYNVRADKSAFKTILVKPVTFAGKNVTSSLTLALADIDKFEVRGAAGNMMVAELKSILSRRDAKKVSDLVAAVLFLHPEVAEWTKISVSELRSYEDVAGKHLISSKLDTISFKTILTCGRPVQS